MNERIKELGRQAMSDVMNGSDPYGDADKMYIPAEFMEKFAKLIVQECALTLYKSAVRDKQAGFAHEAKVMELAGHMIKQHFGIKE